MFVDLLAIFPDFELDSSEVSCLNELIDLSSEVRGRVRESNGSQCG